MRLLLLIALRHLLARKRQSFVSLLGIVLGVAFFMAIASLMRGSENDFLRRLVDNSPHITIQDEYRSARPQPVFQAFPHGAVHITHVTPLPENRGIRGYTRVLDIVRNYPGVLASPSLGGEGIVSFAGRNVGISLSGMVPQDITQVTTIGDYIVQGRIEDLYVNPDGILIGAEMSRKYGIALNDTLTIRAGTGNVHTFKVLAIFRTGRGSYDEKQGFIDITRAQSLMGQINRANSIIIKMQDAYAARDFAAQLEKVIGYKALSWQESSEDIMSTLMIRNLIMYTVVSAVLLVAAFGIYNVISTVVLEKQRDIAILKSMGFEAPEIQRIFVFQGVVLGAAGAGMGVPLGCLFMLGLMQITLKVPGTRELAQMPIDWGFSTFAIAIVFAMTASILAALLPARKAARIEPVDILRGGF